MRKERKTTQGITLIALVVTIVVLLILAGVSISMLTGENGIIRQAQEAKEDTRGGTAKEEVELWKSNIKLDNVTGATTAETKEDLLNRLKNDGTLTEEEVTKLKNGETITIGKSEISLEGITTGGDSGGSDNTSIAGKYYGTETDIIVGETPVTVPGGATISGIPGEYEDVDDGLVIYIMKDADGDGEIDTPDWDNVEYMQETYDQFVWVPVPNAVLDLSNNADALSTEAKIKAAVQSEIDAGRYPMAIKKDETNYFGVLYQFNLDSTDAEKPVVKVEPHSSWTPLSTSYYREPSAVSSYDTSSYLGQVNGILNTSYNDSTSFGNALQLEYNTMIGKVSDNKGFWVGRYETSGMSNSTTTSYETSNEVQVKVVKGTDSGINNVTWYRMYAQQNCYSKLALGTRTTATSSMIWGSQWDQIMIWMKNVKNEAKDSYYVINSLGMGNFGTTDDSYNDTSAPSPTGCYEVKNVYDLAGNVYDWSLEASNTNYRVARRR